MLRGYGVTSQLSDALDQAIAVYPHYMPLYQIVLSTLQPKSPTTTGWRHRHDVRLRRSLWCKRTGRFAAEIAAPAAVPISVRNGRNDLLRQTGRRSMFLVLSGFHMKQTSSAGLEAYAAKALQQFGQMNRYAKETNALSVTS